MEQKFKELVLESKGLLKLTLKLKYRAEEYRADVQPVRAFAALPLDLIQFPACTELPVT